MSDSALSSWNPHVPCTPDLVTIRDVLGPAYPSQTVSGSPYQTNSTAGGIPHERSLSPPCTITNATGQVLSSFVQINGVSMYGYGIKTSDCSRWFSHDNGGGPYPNNQTLCPYGGQIITIGTVSGYLRIEIDRDWLGAGYCGPGVTYCDNEALAQYNSNGTISLDVQGFVFWEGPWHWELHALTAWTLSAGRPSPPQNLAAAAGDASVTLTWQPPASDGRSPIFGYNVFRGTAPGVEFYLASVGNVLTYTDMTVTNWQAYDYVVTAVNEFGESARSNEVWATPSPPPDFGLSAAPTWLSISLGSSGTSTITLVSWNGFSGTISMSTSIACASLACIIYPAAGLDPSSITLGTGETATSTLTVSTSLLTTPGTYTVTISATSGSLTHTVIVTVQVTL